MKVNKTLFSEKKLGGGGAFIRAGAFIRINTVYSAIAHAVFSVLQSLRSEKYSSEI